MMQNIVKFLQLKSAHKHIYQSSRKFALLVHPSRKFLHFFENEKQNSMGVERLDLNADTPIKGVKKTLFVVSDKLGVGKSTIAVNLALAIKNKYPEKKIGLLDTDPIDPTIAKILQIQEKIFIQEAGYYQPIESFGIHCMFLPKEPKPFWAEEDIFGVTEQLVREVAWEGIDLLVVDAPSSYNCLHGIFEEQMPIDGSLLVTTGDSVALQLAKNTLDYYSRMRVPSAGIVVNLAQHKCSKCKHESARFEKNQQQIEQILGQRVLQTFSMDNDIMKSLEAGNPFIQAFPKNIQTRYFEKLACQVTQFLEKPIQITSTPDQTNQKEISHEDIPTINLATEDILNLKK